FVFQAEDGIRHFHVTGVQTCALPIFSNVEQEGPAAEAGIRSGDVIIKFDGKDIKHMTDLPRIVGATKPGTRVDMDVWRKGKAVTLKVKVGEMPAADDEATPEQSEQPKAMPVDALGLKVSELDAATRSKLDIKGGVQVVEAEEPAATAGLAAGDIIVTINDVDITGPDQYAKVVAGLSKSRAAALLVMRGEQSQWITVTPGK